jgi:hypothetical protein
MRPYYYINELDKKYTKEFQSEIFSDREIESKLLEMEEVLIATYQNMMLGITIDPVRTESLMVNSFFITYILIFTNYTRVHKM